MLVQFCIEQIENYASSKFGGIGGSSNLGHYTLRKRNNSFRASGYHNIIYQRYMTKRFIDFYLDSKGM